MESERAYGTRYLRRLRVPPRARLAMDPDELIRFALAWQRMEGIPAVRAHIEGDWIITEVARPRGEG